MSTASRARASLYSQLTHIPLILIPPAPPGRGRIRYAELRGRRVGSLYRIATFPRPMADLLLPGTENPFPGRQPRPPLGARRPR